MTSFFGSIRNLFKTKEKPGQPSRITKYEDEIKLLLDTVVLANPSVLSAGITLFGPASSPNPTLSEAMRGGKITIKSLCELLIGMTYTTEKGTIVLRVNVDEVILGGGKIQLPVLVEDWVNSKAVSQYCMRGSLHPDTLIIAVENFTQKRVRDGLLVYEQSKKAGRLIFDFAQLSSGAIYATAEDNIMLERASEPPYINFTFGRNLYWYVKAQKEKVCSVGVSIGATPYSKENERISVNQLSPARASIKSPSRKTPTKLAPTAHITTEGGIPGAPPAPPPAPPALRALQLGPNGIPVPGTPPPPPGSVKKRRKVRQLYWNKIPQNQLAGTIWKEKGSPSRVAVDIDINELEDMFSLSPMKDASGKPLALGAKDASAAQEKKIQLLDLKRANNGAVLLSQFKNLEYSDIRQALITMDEKNILTIENLISLKYLFPLTDQERHDMVNFKGDPKTTGPAEQFYLATLDVPRPDVRVRMLIFRYQYADVSQQIEAAMHVLRQGSQELVDSDKLAQILQLILKVGRALNGATASGFRLDSLSKLADTKAKDKKTSVLDYLVSITTRQKPELDEFWLELPYLEHVSKLATETIIEGLKEIKDTLDALKLELELISVNMSDQINAKVSELVQRIKTISATSDFVGNSKENAATTQEAPLSMTTSAPEPTVDVDSKFADAYFKAYMSSFYDETLLSYQASKKRYDSAVHTFEKAVKYFGEDPKVTQPPAFFALLTSFIDSWKASKAKLEKSAQDKEKAEKKAQKEAEKEALKRAKEEAKLAATLAGLETSSLSETAAESQEVVETPLIVVVDSALTESSVQEEIITNSADFVASETTITIIQEPEIAMENTTTIVVGTVEMSVEDISLVSAQESAAIAIAPFVNEFLAPVPVDTFHDLDF